MGADVIIGMSGGSGSAAAAAADSSGVLGVCPQERVTRTRSDGFAENGLPAEAIEAVMRSAGHPPRQVSRYVLAGPAPVVAPPVPFESMDQHAAHAATAYLTSSFDEATIVVSDRGLPRVSVWRGTGGQIARTPMAWTGPGFADLYARCAELIGFPGEARGQRMEALARLYPDPGTSPVDRLWCLEGDRLDCAPGWERAVTDAFDRAGGVADRASSDLAAALQGSLTRLLLAFMRQVQREIGGSRLCLGGSLFHHSSINSALRQSGLFEEVFVPVDPGVPGLAVGAALHATAQRPRLVSPFLGSSFDDAAAKQTLDNCKVHYAWESEGVAIERAVAALVAGRLVAWFDGPMEWGPRALGARSILASPASPYVLENLNRYLKSREPWRGYALSGEEAAIAAHFSGPDRAPFMECDFRPRRPEAFAAVLPRPGAALRIQTVGAGAPIRFRQLLTAFGEASGLPILVNTSFNGFREPIVCSPRDALRVFYGTGIDMLVLGSFVLAK